MSRHALRPALKQAMLVRPPVAAAAGLDLSQNLVAYWSLDEASGTRADSVGDNDLTDNNTVTSTTGKQGNAAVFVAANNEYLSVADNDALSMGDIDFTLAGWVMFSGVAATQTIWSKFEVGGNNREYWLIYTTASNRFRFAATPDGSTITTLDASTVGAPSTGQWYFVVCWHDATANTLNIQVNDGTVDSVAYSGGVYSGTAPFVLGAMSTVGTISNLMNGRIDEIGAWKRVLSASERAWLYASGAGRTFAQF